MKRTFFIFLCATLLLEITGAKLYLVWFDTSNPVLMMSFYLLLSLFSAWRSSWVIQNIKPHRSSLFFVSIMLASCFISLLTGLSYGAAYASNILHDGLIVDLAFSMYAFMYDLYLYGGIALTALELSCLFIHKLTRRGRGFERSVSYLANRVYSVQSVCRVA